ncbi:uncharacterized protein LOC128241672 isoform X1 [Mya arenaria]|uniref:uncharacterized protein LOC128241672 isoform X1 n=1 Tax=Mya arenaria TaxID=6604 RepID=UPI0022E64AB4|nr:uncharacterized protein LOC128241672 isoform X1 [Mya arenaria]
MGNKLLYLLLVTVMCLTRGVVGGNDDGRVGLRHNITFERNEHGTSAGLNLDRRWLSGYRASVGGTAHTSGYWERRLGIGRDTPNGLSWNVGSTTNSRGYSRYEGDLSRTYDNGRYGIHGHVDSYGGVGIRGSWSHRWRRSVKAQRFNVTLMADPCDFDFYDHDKDGGISKKEMATIFGDEAGAERLFDALDRESVDGVIVREEFAFAPKVINNCFQDSEEE